jgi:SpoVK/Ycf46/Vps4 family AAA+-type ATPase
VSGTLIESLLRAVEASPNDIELRVHVAELLLDAGRRDEAVTHLAAALQQSPGNPTVQAIMSRALGAQALSDAAQSDPPDPSDSFDSFDWNQAENQVSDVVQPKFVTADDSDQSPHEGAFDVERSTVTLADVGGMTEVKRRLEAAFLAPLRNPELRRLYGKSLRGGLLLYGPPGCGKTFLARAVAGELGAKFLSIGIADVLDMYIGQSERNLHEVFELARREAPCVLFLDEVDALGQRRTQTRASAIRGAVNTLLAELDGVNANNDGVFVLAATNQPWDVDPALRRPGRFDRTVLVLPPDEAARREILRYHLSRRPIEGIDAARLAKQSDGLSGADIAYVCELAAERALTDSVASGQARLIGPADLEASLAEVRPSIGGWLDIARNVVMFGDNDGTYGELRAYLKKTKRL